MSELFPVIEGYALREIVGRGGEATIYAADDERHGRSVAIKVIDGRPFDDGQRRAFTRELRAMGRLGDHPHVVNVFDSGFTAANQPFLVMPLLAKGTISARLKSRGPLAIDELLELGVKIGSALETAHRRGILHCDIKPNNLLVGPWDEPMLADFGISSITNIGLTSTNRVSLTVRYAAPEILDEARPTVASDIYSLGATLFTLAKGEPAYRGATPAAVMKNLLSSTDVPRLERPFPAALSDLIAEMMDHEPTARPISAAQVVTRIQALQEDLELPPTAATFGDPIGDRIALPTGPHSSATHERTGPTTDGSPNAKTTVVQSEAQPAKTKMPLALLGIGALVALAGLLFVLSQRGDQTVDPIAASAIPAVPTEIDQSNEDEVLSAVASPVVDDPTPTEVAPTPPPTPAPPSTPAPTTTESSADALGDDVGPAALEVAFESAAAPIPVLQPIPPPADPATFAILDTPLETLGRGPDGAHFGIVFASDWSTSGLIATGGADQSVRVWDPDGTLLLDLLHDSEVHHVAWSPDGARLAVASREAVVVWDMVSGSSTTLPMSFGVGHIDWSSDGTRLAGAAWRRVLLWDSLTTEMLYTATSLTGGTVAVDLADDGRILAATSDGYILEWDTTVLTAPSVLAAFPSGAYDGSVGYLDPGDQDSDMYIGMPDQPILFFDGPTKTVERSLDDLWHPANIEISPDGTRMLSIGQTSSLRLWDMARGEIIDEIIPTFPNAFSIAWAPDSERLVTTGNEGKAYIYDLSDLGLITTVELRVDT